MRSDIPRFAPAALLCALSLFCAGCSRGEAARVVVWTNSQEFAAYADAFNNISKDQKVVLVYKENPAAALDRGKREKSPDIVAGAFLRSEKMRKNFRALNSIFQKKRLSRSAFYPQLLDALKRDRIQRLLPVSFNLPAVIFAKSNEELLPDNYALTPSQIRDSGKAFNKKKPDGSLERAGFIPKRDSAFLYLTAKTKGADFKKDGGSFTWNEKNLADAVSFLREWTIGANDSPKAESDFAYKYLSMPVNKQVTSGRTLFAYVTSDRLFRMASDQTQDIDFRWVYDGKKIPMEDSIVSLGIPRRAKNRAGAMKFAEWLLSAKTQREILERKKNAPLDTDLFGIAGGFSSLKEVNEREFPRNYEMLLAAMPSPESLSAPPPLPSDWERAKFEAVIPCIESAAAGEDVSLRDALAEWEKREYE